MKNAFLLALVICTQSGCAAFNTYSAAAREMDEFRGYGTYYCWSKDWVKPCATTEAKVDLTKCITSLSSKYGHMHSRRKSKNQLIDCMASNGWHRIEDFTLTH